MKTCLVVDDMKFDRTLIAQCVSNLGFEVIEAASGEEALAACKTALPDWVMLDWEMKEMNGIALLDKLRALDGGQGLYVLLCTSHDHPSFIGHAHTHGANDYLVKPATPARLAEKLREAGMIA